MRKGRGRGGMKKDGKGEGRGLSQAMHLASMSPPGEKRKGAPSYPSIQGHTQRWERGCAKVPVVLNMLFVIESQPYGLLRSCGTFLSCHFLHCFVIHPASVVSLLCFALLPVLLCAVCSSACQGWVPVCFLLPPLKFSFLCSVCLLCAPLPVSCLRCLSSYFPVAGRGWLSLFPPSFPPPACVCVKPQTKPGILARIRLLLTNVWPSSLQISQTLLTFLSDEIETFEL